MSQPFLPHADAPVNGAHSVTSNRVPLPRVGGSVAVRIAWEGGTGYIRFGGSDVEVSAADGIRLPASAGVEVLRCPGEASHLAYMGCAVNLIAGDGV